MTCGVEYGTASKSAKSGRVPVLRMGNIQNAKFDWVDLAYTSDVDEIAEYLLYDGDVLFNRTNSPELVGKSAIFRGEGRLYSPDTSFVLNTTVELLQANT